MKPQAQMAAHRILSVFTIHMCGDEGSILQDARRKDFPGHRALWLILTGILYMYGRDMLEHPFTCLPPNPLQNFSSYQINLQHSVIVPKPKSSLYHSYQTEHTHTRGDDYGSCGEARTVRRIVAVSIKQTCVIHVK
jgi:hypothetical protein